MDKRQVVFIIVVNAAISLVISLSVSLIMLYVFLRSLEAVEVSVGPGAPAQAGGTALPQAPAAIPSPKPTTTIYVVQAGDSLSGIAFQFDVSVEDLMRANGLTNADLLFVGQELIIPIGGLPETPALIPVPTPTETPIPFEPPTPLSTGTPLVVQPLPGETPAPSPTASGTLGPTKEPTPPIFAKPVDVEITEIVGAGNLPAEMVILTNRGQPVNLEGWTLHDLHGNVYTFPGILLWSNNASVRVHTGWGENTATDLYWKLNKAIWETGDKATLADKSGKTIAVYALGD